MLQVTLGVVGLLQGVILHKFYSQEPIWVVEPSRKAFSFSMHGPHGGLLQLHHTALQWVTTALLQLHHSSLCWQVNSHSPPPRSGLLNTLNTIITHGKLPCADTYYFPYHSFISEQQSCESLPSTPVVFPPWLQLFTPPPCAHNTPGLRTSPPGTKLPGFVQLGVLQTRTAQEVWKWLKGSSRCGCWWVTRCWQRFGLTCSTRVMLDFHGVKFSNHQILQN